MPDNNKKKFQRQHKQKRKTIEAKTFDLSGKKKGKNLSIIFIFLLVIIAFSPTFINGFTNWDDTDQVVKNADITSLSFHNLKIFFTSYYLGMYQPLATLSFALIFKFFGLKALAYHSFSLLLHLANTYMVYKLIMKLAGKKEIISGVTILFALNPLQAEAVAWVSATSTLLYSMFFLLSINMYLNFITIKNNKKKYYYSLLFFFPALLSKSTAITLPLILLLFDYFLKAKISKKDIMNKIPFLVLSLIFGIVTVIGRDDAGDFFNITKHYTFFDRFFFILYSLSFYFISIIVPFKMSAFHAYPDKSGGMLPVIFYLMPLLLIGIIVFIIKLKRCKKEIIFGILFFLICISIMIELIPVGNQIVKERYNYIPCIGLYYAFLTFLFIYFERKEKLKKIINYGVAALSIIFLVLTFTRTLTWKDSFSLWNDVIKKYPGCYEAYYNRGVTYVNKGLYDKAIYDYTKAIEIKPDYAQAFNNRGAVFEQQGLYDKAITDYIKAIEIKPDYAEAYYNRGLSLDYQGKYDNAINDYTKAIELKHDYAEAYYNRGLTYGIQELYNKAVEDFTKAIEIKSNYADAFNNRGVAYFQQGSFDKACRDVRKAEELGSKEAIDNIKKFCK